MHSQFWFTLLNPALSLVLSGTFIYLWFRRPTSRYLLLIGTAFLLNGAAFVVMDHLKQFDGPLLRIASNGLFFTAILLACVGALYRVGVQPPAVATSILCWVTWLAFLWFLLAEPSTAARIYVVSFAYACMSGFAAWSLIKAGPQLTVDWLFIGLAILLFLLSIGRPLATWWGALDLNEGGAYTSSDYWNTVLAFTPVVAVLVSLAFLAALVSQIVAELRQEANRDYLTGLLNRRGFDKMVQQALSRAGLGQQAPALMIADIDDFKKINDTFGHAIGDQVIALVARILLTVGTPDAAGRTGGEEFALYYQRRSETSLLVAVDRIRAALRTSRLAGIPQDYPITVSIGIHMRDHKESLIQMMAKADAALYLAKHKGKDQAVMLPTESRRAHRRTLSDEHRQWDRSSRSAERLFPVIAQPATRPRSKQAPGSAPS